MDKMIIKVTLNSRNPGEAELISILQEIQNKSAYMKMAAFHYCNVLGRLSLSDGSRENVSVKSSENTESTEDNEKISIQEL